MRFRYRGRNRAGALQVGSIDEESTRAAVLALAEQQIWVIALEEEREEGCEEGCEEGHEGDREEGREKGRNEGKKLSPGTVLRRLRRRQRVTSVELAHFCEQLATLLAAGVALFQALRIISEQVNGSVLREVLAQVAHRLEGGVSLRDALAEYPRIFPALMIHMVEAGELGGVLDQVLARLAEHLQKEEEIIKKFTTALIYPGLVLAASAVVFVFTLVVVLPSFAGILKGLGVELPAVTRGAMALAEGVEAYGVPVLLFGLVLAGVGYRYVGPARIGRFWDQLLLQLPVAGVILRKLTAAQFCRTMGLLLRCGVPLLPSLELSTRGVSNEVIRTGLVEVGQDVQRGWGMAAPLRNSGLFPSMVVEMISIGEESGALDTMLMRVGDYYDKEVGATAQRIGAMAEPLLLMVISMVVLFLVFSVLLPIFELMGTMAE
ncbi:type II secretion system F family protein [Heliophilum fasciatum]|uniref:Type II secretion system protein F (GspF) n=1 Tax=Heliophilum fasciatum TaxID=35700 RepID=A0A4R2RWL1_9FIRM|nr:type II secretion system F family protein [Heliophilum fasciatum]MCW2277310.1 type IV pilus assembly protein PilC [Heliophilum fasciatum]TCP67147.1 type II secretion system protein F (GspF) [Heliophilum fasciatum]